MKRKIIATLLIGIGIGCLLYPKAMESYRAYRQQKIIEEWQNNLSLIDEGDGGAQEGADAPLESKSLENDVDIEEENELSIEEENQITSDEEQRLRDNYIINNMAGILEIDKIDLKLPILEGVTKQNLNISIASMTPIGQLGKSGNYVIAGHRSHGYGINFNRLDEMELGDRIKVDNGGEVYTYTVVEKLYVLPEEVWVMEDKELKEITLITCHPMINPTHRLIIKGQLIE